MKKYLLIATFAILNFLFFVNCSSSSSNSNPANNQNEQTQTPVTPITIDPWTAPVGDLIQGAKLDDGWYDLREVSGVNVSGGWTDSAAISSNGKNLYFSYSRFNFANLVENGTVNSDGPLRTGMTGSHFKNFRAELTATGWSVVYLPFNTDPNMHESSVSLNESEDLAVFSRWDSSGSVASLFFTAKDSSGNWSAPQQLPTTVFGTNCSNDNPFIVGNLTSGVDVYFESNRSNLACSSTGSEKHIYHTFYNPTLDQYSAIAKVPGINGTFAGDDDTQFFVTPDKKHAYWTAIRVKPGSEAYSIFTADLVAGAFVNARPVVTPNFASPFTGKLTFAGEANIVELPQGYLMYLMCGMATKETGQVHGVNLKICRAKKDKYPDSAKKINTAGWSDSPFISRDGKRLYFMYSRWDFSPLFTTNDPSQVKIKGPDRLGLHKNDSPFDESDIYVSTKNPDGSWGEPVNLGINGNYGDASGMEFNGGNSFIWLKGIGNSKNNLTIVSKNPDGSWGDPVDMGSAINIYGKNSANEDIVQDNPHISADGNFVWFTSNRNSGKGGKDIWFTAKSGGTWISPVNLDSNFNNSGDQDQYFILENTGEIYWNGPLGIMHCVSNGTTCSAPPTVVTIPGCSYPAEVSLPDDQQTMYFACGDFSTGRIKIMYSKKTNGVWGTATPVD